MLFMHTSQYKLLYFLHLFIFEHANAVVCYASAAAQEQYVAFEFIFLAFLYLL